MATALRARSGCAGEPPAPRVVLRWQPEGTGEQRVDVSVLDNDFEPGTFASSPLLSPSTARLRWPTPQGEATHLWRVRTRVEGKWVDSLTARFPGPGCVGIDLQP